MSQRRAPRDPVDWAAIEERVKQAQETTREALDPSPERVRQIMAERTRNLAGPPEPAPAPDEVVEVLAFVVGGEHHALETRYVHELMPLAQLTPVPGSPVWVAGVTNRRGDILLVVDLGELLNLAPRNFTSSGWVVVVGTERAEFCLLTEAGAELLVLHSSEVFPVHEKRAGIRDRLVLGVTAGALALLDGDALLRDPRLFVEQHEADSASDEEDGDA